MGAKGSKPPAVAGAPGKTIEISAEDIIDPSDPTIFPEVVRNELMAVKAEIPPGKAFFVKEFNETSELVKWIRRSKGYFDWEEEKNENAPNNLNNLFNMPYNAGPPPSGNNTLQERLARLRSTNRPTAATAAAAAEAELPPEQNALAIRLARLRNQRAGASVNRNKDHFLYKLFHMCSGGEIREQFLANLIETADRFLFAFLNTGHIAGFTILGEDIEGDRRCLHRYVTCTGPRKLGIGAEIVKEVHAIAKREGYTCVTLGASASEGFHAKQGYVRTGKHTSEGPEMIYRIPQTGGKRKRKQTKTRKHRK